MAGIPTVRMGPPPLADPTDPRVEGVALDNLAAVMDAHGHRVSARRRGAGMNATDELLAGIAAAGADLVATLPDSWLPRRSPRSTRVPASTWYAWRGRRTGSASAPARGAAAGAR